MCTRVVWRAAAYGSVVATAYDAATTDGVNERGLGAHLLGSAEADFGARPNISATIWRTLADLTNGVYAFESSYSPDIVWTHLDGVDLGRAALLDVTREGLVGDVTDRYEPAEPFSFASASAFA